MNVEEHARIKMLRLRRLNALKKAVVYYAESWKGEDGRIPPELKQHCLDFMHRMFEQLNR